MTSKTHVAVIAAVLTAALGLTGCGSADKKPSAVGVEKKADGSVVLKDPTGDVTAKVDSDSGGITIKSQDGDITAGKGLPNGFPTDEIPVLDGDVVGGSKGNAGGPYAFTVLMQVDGSSPSAVLAEITKQLKGAGFTATPGMTMNEMSTSTYKGSKYDVGVNAVKGGGRITVTYVVKKS